MPLTPVLAATLGTATSLRAASSIAVDALMSQALRRGARDAPQGRVLWRILVHEVVEQIILLTFSAANGEPREDCDQR